MKSKIRLIRMIRWIFVLATGLLGWSGSVAVRASEAGGHEGLTPAAPVLFHVGPLAVTNSMVITWITALVLIIGVRKAMRNPKLIPEGAQNFVEWIVEGVYNFFAGILGERLCRRTFWFFATLLIFITATNYVGLIPGVGSIGWGVGEHWYNLEITRPLFRGGNADLNMTFAMAILFFILWFVWAIQENGFLGFLKHIFGLKGGGFPKFAAFLLGILFFFVGLIEVVSIFFRPIALAFRLYGNIFAGENMIEGITLIGGYFGWLLAIPFYFLELLFGLVQALVFSLLSAIFLLEICTHEEEGSGH